MPGRGGVAEAPVRMRPLQRKTADQDVVGGCVLLLQLDSNQQPFD
jgi:hypothetical protein